MNSADLRADPARPIVDLTQPGAPIYVQLSTLFRRFIVTGQWPVEKQIPTHEDIAAQFDVNPATVRKAIALLEDEGLVKRFRRRGTFVTAKPAAVEGFQIPTRWEDALRAYDGLAAETLESRKLKLVPAPFHAPGAQARGYAYARTLYRRGARAVAVEETYTDRAVRMPRNGAGAHPLRRLERSGAIRIERAEQTLRFGIADREIASVLDIALNAPIAVAHLSVFGRGAVLHFESTSFFRGDMARVSESIRFAERRP